MYRSIARYHMKVKLKHRKITFAKNGTLIFTADMYDASNAKLAKFYTDNPNWIKFIVEHPDQSEYIDNMFPFEKELDGYYLRVDKNGKPVLKNGKATIIHKMKIWAKQTKDMDTGELMWVENPEVMIHRILFHCYMPVSVE